MISWVAALPYLQLLEFGNGLRVRPLHVDCVMRMHLKHRPRDFVCPKVGIIVLNVRPSTRGLATSLSPYTVFFTHSLSVPIRGGALPKPAVPLRGRA